MVKASVVIGANYGDEGKGLMTDYLARLHNADLVVRFNGGAQAGHTVVTADGRRHVFSHFGSGAFTGARTYLSQFFIVNPMKFKTEWDELNALIPGFNNHPYVDHNCIVTTPWDILYNQVCERLRNDSRHGSCGMGIYQTIYRHEHFPVSLTVTKLTKQGKTPVAETLADIRRFYVKSLHKLSHRFHDPRSIAIINETKKTMENSGIFVHFLSDCLFFIEHTLICSCFPHSKYIIFEGSQGLGLDQCMGVYPHVTPSNTGIRNVRLLQQDWGFTIEEIVYVTRSYFTRHGAGPLEGEEPWPIVSPDTVVDNTNIENEWQGRIRYAPMNWTTLRERIYRDRVSNNITAPYKLAVTHCDFPYGHDSCEHYNSYGPTAEDVRKHD